MFFIMENTHCEVFGKIYGQFQAKKIHIHASQQNMYDFTMENMQCEVFGSIYIQFQAKKITYMHHNKTCDFHERENMPCEKFGMDVSLGIVFIQLSF